MAKAKAAQGLRLEYVPLSKVQGRADNAKDHDVGAIIQSMQRFGFASPLQLDERTGKLVAGHGRVKALRALQDNGQDPPRRVFVAPGGKDWLVPAVRGADFADDLDALAYSIADNRLVEIGGWLDQQLADALGRLESLNGVGFDDDDLRDLLKKLAGPNLGDEHDESIAKGVKLCSCPTCGHEHHATDTK